MYIVIMFVLMILGTVTCSLLAIPVSCVDPDGSVNEGKNNYIIMIYFNLQSPYCHMNNSIYNSSSHYKLLR
jgi:hypothetical protein